jgi:hypothetical protein
MFVTAGLGTTFHTLCEGLLMIYLHTKLHMRSYSISLVTTTKLKVKENFHMAAMIFYILSPPPPIIKVT